VRRLFDKGVVRHLDDEERHRWLVAKYTQYDRYRTEAAEYGTDQRNAVLIHTKLLEPDTWVGEGLSRTC
jgi:hypothetical protein